MVGLRKSSAVNGEQQNIREVVIVKKRKQLDQERAIDEEKEHKNRSAIDEKEDQKRKKRAIVENRNERTIVKTESAIVENRNEIDEIEEQKVVFERKRNQLEEEIANLEIKNETDEDVSIEIAVGDKEDQKGKKRKQLDEERAVRKTIDEEQKLKEIVIVRKRIRLNEGEKRKEEKEQDRIVGEEICSKSLPEELWTENILTRLPARTLARCSFVSKLWYNSYSKDMRFAALHNVQNKNKTSLIFNLLNVFRGGIDSAYFFSLEDEDNHLDPKLLTHLRTPDICELVGYCNGLACYKEISIPGDAVGGIAVVNPIRSQTLTLRYITPTGGYMYLCHGFGFDSLSQVYKAVIIFTSKDNDEFHCMVITLGTSSWRNITITMAEISPPPGSSPFPSRMVTRVWRSFCKQATLCGGDLLWRTTSEVDNDCKIQMLLSFDLHNEKIQFIRLPSESTPTTTMNERQYLVVDHLLEFKGYPCIARSEKITISNSDHCGHHCDYQSNFSCCCCCCCKVHMYILKDKVKQVWVREKTFDVQIKDQEGLLPAPLCCYFETSAVTPPTRILTLSNQVLLYWFNGESLILYNLLEKQLKVVKCSSSYPGIFQTKMNETLGRCIGDDNNIDCPYMDYQLYAQVENLVSMKTFIPEGAKTRKYDCFEDLQHAIKSSIPLGCVNMGRSLNCYSFREDKEVDDEVSNNVEGLPDGSCVSKQSTSKKNSGKARRTLTAKKSKKVQSMGSEYSELLNAFQTTIELCKRYSVPRSLPVENWMVVLEGVPDLDEDLRLDAVNFLGGDPVCARTFLVMSPNIRTRWLIAKLRGN